MANRLRGMARRRRGWAEACEARSPSADRNRAGVNCWISGQEPAEPRTVGLSEPSVPPSRRLAVTIASIVPPSVHHGIGISGACFAPRQPGRPSLSSPARGRPSC